MEPNQLASDWMHADELLAQHLERGDLVEIRRATYTHWAVYIGRLPVDDVPCIVHISTESSDLGVSSTKEFGRKLLKGCAATVRGDPFLQVAGADLCRVNNSLDSHRRPFPPSIVVERAQLKLGTGGYNIIRNNCEHFAKWCRYNLNESEQGILGCVGMFAVGAMVATSSIPTTAILGTSSYVILKIGQSLQRRWVTRAFL